MQHAYDICNAGMACLVFTRPELKDFIRAAERLKESKVSTIFMRLPAGNDSAKQLVANTVVPQQR